MLNQLKTEKCNINLLGYDEHANAFSKNIITFYLQSRMYLLGILYMMQRKPLERKLKNKNLAMQSKLI